MRTLTPQELMAVSGGQDVIVVTTTQPAPDGATVITPDMWLARGMTAQEYIFGSADVLSFEPATFSIGPDQDETFYNGVSVNVDEDGDGQTDFTVNIGFESPGDGTVGDGIGGQIVIPF